LFISGEVDIFNSLFENNSADNGGAVKVANNNGILPVFTQ